VIWKQGEWTRKTGPDSTSRAWRNVRPLRMCLVAGLVGAAALPRVPASLRAQEAAEYREARHAMVSRQIESALGGRDPVTDTAVLRAMRAVPRHRFVRPADRNRAYADQPLPIGYGQTISQPYIVAAMTQLLVLRPGESVLEIGTGSGYQAAVLAEITDSVYTIEIVEPLAEAARQRLEDVGYRHVRTMAGDGYWGWPGHPPFDAIVVTAAASQIPPPLLEQLKPGARMVIPVGAPVQVQALMLV